MQITLCFVIIMLISSIEALNNFADTICGQIKGGGKRGKIVGGSNAGRSEFPWIVSVTRRGGHFCGGSVLTNKHILTAGHCMCSGLNVDLLKPSNIKITIGQHDLSQASTSGAYEVSVRSITVHPEYLCNKPRNDIAVVELETTLRWSESVLPACLPTAFGEDGYKKFDNDFATIAGWGWTNEDNRKGSRAKILQKAKVQVIETEKCKQWYKSQGKKTKIQNTQICAGYEQGGIDSCWADSGGPLMVATGNGNQVMVVGVVSTGIGCARPYLPGLYTRISEYIPWIRSIVNV